MDPRDAGPIGVFLMTIHDYPNIMSNANTGAVLCATNGQQQRFQKRNGRYLSIGNFGAFANALRRAPEWEVPRGDVEV